MDADQSRNDYIKSLLDIAAFLRQGRTRHEAFMEEVCAFFAPELMRYESDREIVFGRDLNDGYAGKALDTWAKGIPGNMVYRDAKWLNMRLNIRTLADNNDVKKYCDETSEVVFWAARRSNFYRVQPEFARHAGVMGGYMFPTRDEPNAAVSFVLEDPWKVFVARDGLGRVSMVMRELTKTVGEWAKEFGQESLPNTWREYLTGQTRRPYQKQTVVHLMFENPDYAPITQNVNQRRWKSVYLGEGEKFVLHEDTTDHGVIDWCVRRPAGWDYPATPAMYAYVDALTNDVLTETLVRAARLAADPPMRAMSRLAGKIDRGYGGITFIDRPEDILEQVQKMGQYPAGEAEREHVRACLDHYFGLPFFEVLTRMEGSPPTAYHIRQLSAEKATLLGPEVGSYREDALDPSVDVLLAEEAELTGDVPERPGVLDDFLRERVQSGLERMGLELSEKNFNAYLQNHPLGTIEAVYNGVLTAIETEMVQTRMYADGMAFLEAASAIWPTAPLVAKEEIVLRNALEAYNWSGEDLRSKDEFKEAVDAMAQREEMMRQAELMGQVTKSQQQSAQADQIERKG